VGPVGPQGIPGSNGAQGPIGPQGPEGSAYALKFSRIAQTVIEPITGAGGLKTVAFQGRDIYESGGAIEYFTGTGEFRIVEAGIYELSYNATALTPNTQGYYVSLEFVETTDGGSTTILGSHRNFEHQVDKDDSNIMSLSTQTIAQLTANSIVTLEAHKAGTDDFSLIDTVIIIKKLN
jgi:hypothetical protein